MVDDKTKTEIRDALRDLEEHMRAATKAASDLEDHTACFQATWMSLDATLQRADLDPKLRARIESEAARLLPQLHRLIGIAAAIATATQTSTTEPAGEPH